MSQSKKIITDLHRKTSQAKQNEVSIRNNAIIALFWWKDAIAQAKELIQELIATEAMEREHINSLLRQYKTNSTRAEAELLLWKLHQPEFGMWLAESPFPFLQLCAKIFWGIKLPIFILDRSNSLKNIENTDTELVDMAINMNNTRTTTVKEVRWKFKRWEIETILSGDKELTAEEISKEIGISLDDTNKMMLQIQNYRKEKIASMIKIGRVEI
jgi:hypothetical protein